MSSCVQSADTVAPATVQAALTAQPLFEVVARTLTGNVYRLHFAPFPSVGELKQRLQDHNGHVPSETMILRRGCRLADDDCLDDGDTISVLRRTPPLPILGPP